MCTIFFYFSFFNDTATTEIYTLSLHDALPIFGERSVGCAPICGFPKPALCNANIIDIGVGRMESDAIHATYAVLHVKCPVFRNLGRTGRGPITGSGTLIVFFISRFNRLFYKSGKTVRLPVPVCMENHLSLVTLKALPVLAGFQVMCFFERVELELHFFKSKSLAACVL